MSMVGFPLLLIPLAIYNIIVFLMPGVSFADPLVKLTLMSGAEWPLTLSDILLALGIVLLLLEVIKGARPGLQISHRSSAVADRIRRRGRRIPAVAAVRHLDLFPAGYAGAGGFPVGHCVACAAWMPVTSGSAVSEARVSHASRCRAATSLSPILRLRHRAGGGVGRRNPCCRITPNRRSRIPRSHQMRPSREVLSPELQPGEGSPSPRMRHRTDWIKRLQMI